MTRWPAPAALAAVAAVVLPLAGCGGNGGSKLDASGAARSTTVSPPPLQAAPSPAAPSPEETQEARAARLRPPLAFQLRRRAQLRSGPGGKVIKGIGLRTEFKSPRIMSVAARRPGWVAVRTEQVPNGRVGWLPIGAGTLYSQPRTIEIDLSRRLLIVRQRGIVQQRIKVAIGAPGTHTPVGTFAVTDLLHTGGTGGPYGCCILALTARQPNLAQGWGGGDRIAIHGTTGTSAIGKAVSNGCIRATNAAARRLMRTIRLGAPVRIHR
jgi:lipoprotein-anchoring transpeptidase ErfK/SrfK